MKRMIKNISLLLSVVAVLVACERKGIYDECLCDETLSIPIDIDWTKSGIELQNVTVLIYDHDSGKLAYEHTYEHNSREVQSHVKLPVGEYDMVVFNELRDQIDYLSCVGYQNYSTLKFQSNDDDPLRVRVESPTVTRSYIKQSGDLAVVTVSDVEVTEKMIVEAAYAEQSGTTKAMSEATNKTIASLTDVEPLKRNNTIDVTVHIEGLNNARMPALADLTNLADGYLVASDSHSTSTIQFTMDNRTYDEGSTTDGTISITLSAFGALKNRDSAEAHDDTNPIMLDVLFKLVDDEQTEVQRAIDVTEDILFTPQEDGSILLSIYGAIGRDEDDDDEPEVKPLPDVKPDPDNNGDDSGFGSNVEDWDKVEVPVM